MWTAILVWWAIALLLFGLALVSEAIDFLTDDEDAGRIAAVAIVLGLSRD